MSGSIKRMSQHQRFSESLVGLVLGLAVAVPAGSGEWSSSFLARGLGMQRAEVGTASGAIRPISSEASDTGLRASFDQDFGSFVLGGTYEQGRGAALAGFGGFEQGQRIDLRAGYDFGRSIGYITFGEVGVERSAADLRSQVIGFGLRVSVNRVLQMTGEVLHRENDHVGRLGALGGDVLSVQAAFRF
jgi:hypothetical protein